MVKENQEFEKLGFGIKCATPEELEEKLSDVDRVTSSSTLQKVTCERYFDKSFLFYPYSAQITLYGTHAEIWRVMRALP